VAVDLMLAQRACPLLINAPIDWTGHLLTAALLLVAIIGAVVIWRRHEPRSRTAQPARISEPRSLVMHR